MDFCTRACAASFTRTPTVEAFLTRTTRPLDRLLAATFTMVRESVHRHGSITVAFGSFTQTANCPVANPATLKLPSFAEVVVAVAAAPAAPLPPETGVVVTVPLFTGLAEMALGVALTWTSVMVTPEIADPSLSRTILPWTCPAPAAGVVVPA